MEYKVLLWAPFGAGTHYWGPGTSAYRLYKGLKTDNVKVTLVHASDKQGVFNDVFDEQVQLGRIDNRSFFSLIKFMIKSLIWIKKHHKDFDVFHGITAYYFSFIPAYFFQKYGKPAFLKISGIQGGFENNGLISKLSGFAKFRRKYANNLAGYISISSDITQSLLLNGVERTKIHYIPNGVNTNRFRPVSKEEKIRLREMYSISNKFTLVYVGGLTKNKNVIETVCAVKDLVEKGIKVQFLIVGPDRSGGLVEQQVESFIRRNKLEAVCIRIKHTVEPEVYFQMSDLFILNSRYEGLSNSLLEAMSTGLPCLAYPASGTIDLIDDGLNGFLTNGEKREIFDKTKELYVDHKKYEKFSTTARIKILNHYSTEKVLSSHLELFEKQLNKI